MITRRLLILLTLFTLSLRVYASDPIQVRSFNCDFDDNIFVTSARVKFWDENSKKEVDVSTADWAMVKTVFGKNGPLRNLSFFPKSFEDFGDTGPLGSDLFKSQIEKALQNKDDSWKGPSWNSFVEALSSPNTLKYTTIITARLHSPQSILAGLEFLKSKGLLPAVPLQENIYSVGWSGLAPQFQDKSDATRKSKVMLYLLDQIEKVKLPENSDYVDDSDGRTKAKLHTWGFSDDDYENFSKARDVLSPQVAAGRWPHIKIELFYTGLNNPDHQPHTVILKTDGKRREALQFEGMHQEILTRLKSPQESKTYFEGLLKKLAGSHHPLGSLPF